jgi:hypothetical protein
MLYLYLSKVTGSEVSRHIIFLPTEHVPALYLINDWCECVVKA